MQIQATDPHLEVCENGVTGESRPFGAHAEELIVRVVAPLAGALVFIEAALMFAGVVARYGFDQPLSWIDELAAILFLWLAMLGAVLASARGDHMRLTFLTSRMGPTGKALLETLGTVVVATLLATLLPFAVMQAREEWEIITPALEWPDGVRVMAIGVGLLLMLLVALAKLQARAKVSHVLLSVAVVFLVGSLLWLGKPMLSSMGNIKLVLYFVGIVGVCVLIGVPIGFAFGIATVAYLVSATRVPVEVVVGRMDEGMAHLILLSIPLFVLLGLIMEMAGLARALVSFIALLLGHVRGGLSYVLLGAMYVVSGISGSKAADMAAVAPMLLPEMKKRGLDQNEMVAQLAASGAITETIPPSFVLIIIGSVTGVSIASLFTGGLLPAFVAALIVGVVCYWKSSKEDAAGIQKPSMREIGRSAVYAFPALALPFVIRAAVVEGVATATEVSTIGIVYCVLVGALLYRKMEWRRIYPMLVDTACLSGAILIIIGMATAMAWALTQSGFSTYLGEIMLRVPGGALGFMAVSILVFIVLGSLLEGIPAIVLLGPLFFPIAKAVGIHEVHYAIVAVLAMGLGLFAPPFGVGFYAACAIGRAEPDAVVGRIWPYLGAVLVALLLVAAVPWITTGFL